MGLVHIKRKYLIVIIVLTILCITVPGLYGLFWVGRDGLYQPDRDLTQYEIDVNFNPYSKR